MMSANAQEIVAPISTERPSVGYSPDLVPPHSIQIENGVGLLLESNKSVLDLPESLIRLGLTRNLELRFLTKNENYKWPRDVGTPSLQSSDPSLSLKVGLGGHFPLDPKAAIVSVSMPLGGAAWTSGSYDPGIAFIWAQTMKKNYFFNEIGAATSTNHQGLRCVTWSPSISGGRSFSASLSGFIEYAPAILADKSSLYIVDAGLNLSHKSLSQFDIRSGYQKDATGYHALLSIGYSVRRDNVFAKLRILLPR